MFNPIEVVRMSCAVLALLAVFSFAVYFKFVFELAWSVLGFVYAGIFNTVADTLYVLCVVFNALTACIIEIVPEMLQSWRCLIVFGIAAVFLWIVMNDRYRYPSHFER